MFGQLTKDLERVSQSLFGGVMRGLPNDTLTVAGSGPWSFDGSFRRWASFPHGENKLV